MRTRMNLTRFFCCLLVAVIGMTIARAQPEPTARLIRSEGTTCSDIQLKNYFDCMKIYFDTSGRSRYGKRNDAAPMMELNATWETLKMIQDAQRQNEQRRRGNIRQNKEQIPLRDFPSSNDEYTSRVATRFDSLSDVISKYYDDANIMTMYNK